MLCFSSHLPFQVQDPRILKGQTRIDMSQLMPLDDKTHSLSIHTSHPGQTPKSQGLTFHHYVVIPLPIEALGGCLAPPVDLHRGPSYQGRSSCIAFSHPEELPLVSQPIHYPLVGADAVPAPALSPLTCTICMHTHHGSLCKHQNSACGLSLAVGTCFPACMQARLEVPGPHLLQELTSASGQLLCPHVEPL